jgi:hypothetical protein
MRVEFFMTSVYRFSHGGLARGIEERWPEAWMANEHDSEVDAKKALFPTEKARATPKV